MPNPDGSLTPEEQAIAAGGVPQPAEQPADGTLTNPTAYLAPPPGAPPAAPTGPAPTGDPLLDFVPPGASPAPSATPAPVPSAADAVPLPTSTPFPRGAVKSETLVPSPQARQGADRLQAVAGDERKLVADQAKTAEDEARINQDTADRAAEERDRQIAETRANQQAERDRLALVNQERDRAIQDAEKLSKENGGVNGEAAVRGIMALASVVLAGSGRTAASGVFRVGGALLDRKIDGEIRARDAAVKAKYQAIAARDGMNDDIARQYAQAQAENAANNLVMLKNVEAHGAAQLTALGVPKAEQAARLADLGIQQKAAEEEQKLGLAISSKVEAKPVSAGGGGPGVDRVEVEMNRMAESGASRSELLAYAVANRVPMKVRDRIMESATKAADGRTKRMDAERGKEEKAQAAEDAATVTLVDGSPLKLPTARAVPQFVKGYNSRVQAAEKLRALLNHVKEQGNVMTPDAVAERDALIHDANVAVASISSMGQSDHSTHIELGTLGPVSGRRIPFLQAGTDVGAKLVAEKLKQVEEGTEREIRTYRHEGKAEKPATTGGEAKPAKAAKDDHPIGSVAVLKDGRQYRKTAAGWERVGG